MALKTLLLRNKLELKKQALDELRKKDTDFAQREAELENAIGEMDETATEEDRKVVEDAVEAFDVEKDAHEKNKKDLEQTINAIEEEIEEEEARSQQAAALTTPAPATENNQERNIETTMSNRAKFFDMNHQERTAFFADETIKSFLGEVRTCIRENRALTNVGLTIPDNMLPLIRQKTEEYSKLISRVTVRSLTGTSRMNIMGEIPEGYWDEMCATLKELSLSFSNLEMDGFMVSGYFAVCNATLEDSDLNLAYELIDALGRALGKALDKAILYGKDVKMPMGIVTSLLKKTAPDNYPSTGRTWEDLSTSHVLTGASATGIALFQDIVKQSGIIDNDYSTNEITWVMNKKTHTKILAESMGANSSAAIVAGMGNAMPVIGGTIVEFKYIPDDTIIFGYFENYLLVQRAGLQLATSEHVRFIENQTVFKGTARYDGDLVIREAFAVYGLGKAPNTSAPSFAGE